MIRFLLRPGTPPRKEEEASSASMMPALAPSTPPTPPTPPSLPPSALGPAKFSSRDVDERTQPSPPSLPRDDDEEDIMEDEVAEIWATGAPRRGPTPLMEGETTPKRAGGRCSGRGHSRGGASGNGSGSGSGGLRFLRKDGGDANVVAIASLPKLPFGSGGGGGACSAFSTDGFDALPASSRDGHCPRVDSTSADDDDKDGDLVEDVATIWRQQRQQQPFASDSSRADGVRDEGDGEDSDDAQFASVHDLVVDRHRDDDSLILLCQRNAGDESSGHDIWTNREDGHRLFAGGGRGRKTSQERIEVSPRGYVGNDSRAEGEGGVNGEGKGRGSGQDASSEEDEAAAGRKGAPRMMSAGEEPLRKSRSDTLEDLQSLLAEDTAVAEEKTLAVEPPPLPLSKEESAPPPRKNRSDNLADLQSLLAEDTDMHAEPPPPPLMSPSQGVEPLSDVPFWAATVASGSKTCPEEVDGILASGQLAEEKAPPSALPSSEADSGGEAELCRPEEGSSFPSRSTELRRYKTSTKDVPSICAEQPASTMKQSSGDDRKETNRSSSFKIQPLMKRQNSIDDVIQAANQLVSRSAALRSQIETRAREAELLESREASLQAKIEIVRSLSSDSISYAAAKENESKHEGNGSRPKPLPHRCRTAEEDVQGRSKEPAASTQLIEGKEVHPPLKRQTTFDEVLDIWSSGDYPEGSSVDVSEETASAGASSSTSSSSKPSSCRRARSPTSIAAAPAFQEFRFGASSAAAAAAAADEVSPATTKRRGTIVKKRTATTARTNVRLSSSMEASARAREADLLAARAAALRAKIKSMSESMTSSAADKAKEGKDKDQERGGILVRAIRSWDGSVGGCLGSIGGAARFVSIDGAADIGDYVCDSKTMNDVDDDEWSHHSAPAAPGLVQLGTGLVPCAFDQDVYDEDEKEMDMDAYANSGENADKKGFDEDARLSIPRLRGCHTVDSSFVNGHIDVTICPEDDSPTSSSEYPPYILSPEEMSQVVGKVLPPALSSHRWTRLYCLARDGDSFGVFLNRAGGASRSLLVVRTSTGDVLGAYADSPWSKDKAAAEGEASAALGGGGGGVAFYGSALACLFRLDKCPSGRGEGIITAFHWTGDNRYIQLVDVRNRTLAMGGGGEGGNFGLVLEEDFRRGSTARCGTFGNDPLCDDEHFDVVDVECWGFDCGFD